MIKLGRIREETIVAPREHEKSLHNFSLKLEGIFAGGKIKIMLSVGIVPSRTKARVFSSCFVTCNVAFEFRNVSCLIEVDDRTADRTETELREQF
jgi:hypothetical protein